MQYQNIFSGQKRIIQLFKKHKEELIILMELSTVPEHEIVYSSTACSVV